MNKSINIAIMIGRSGSKGLPGKNVRKVLGRPLAEYPIIAAKKSKCISIYNTNTNSLFTIFVPPPY